MYILRRICTEKLLVRLIDSTKCYAASILMPRKSGISYLFLGIRGIATDDSLLSTGDVNGEYSKAD